MVSLVRADRAPQLSWSEPGLDTHHIKAITCIQVTALLESQGQKNVNYT